ncbi:MAG: hypothetical protein NVS3B20_01100 [Polyangiales bacterium]
MDGDYCKRALSNFVSDAQADQDAIATFQTIRTIGGITAGVGIVTAAIGVVRLVTASPDRPDLTQREVGWLPQLTIGRNSAWLSVQGNF